MPAPGGDTAVSTLARSSEVAICPHDSVLCLSWNRIDCLEASGPCPSMDRFGAVESAVATEGEGALELHRQRSVQTEAVGLPTMTALFAWQERDCACAARC